MEQEIHITFRFNRSSGKVGLDEIVQISIPAKPGRVWGDILEKMSLRTDIVVVEKCTNAVTEN